MEGQTNNGIDWTAFISSPEGAIFTLYPIIGKHKASDIRYARKYLYKEHDVLGRIRIEWRNPVGKRDDNLKE